MEKIYYNSPLLNRSSELRKDVNFLRSVLDSENVNFIPMKDDENYFWLELAMSMTLSSFCFSLLFIPATSIIPPSNTAN